jgi:signal peptidase I
MTASCSSSGQTPGTNASGASTATPPADTYQLTVGSDSMSPALKQGQVILLTLVTGTYQPHRGDIIVFRDPGGWLADNTQSRDIVKRVVGLPGEEVRCAQPQGQVAVNGTLLAEPYVAPGDHPCALNMYDAKVPAGHLWVLGDHRDVSVDSAVHYRDNPQSGFVPLRDVIGIYKD